MLIYFKKEKIPQLDIIKIKLKNITIANSQESKHIKTNLRKKNQLTKRSPKKQNGKKNQVRSTKLMSERSCE
jgi:hypothetical protein